MLLKEKNEYTAEGLMMLLDNERLAGLEEEFCEHQNGIELPNFIWLIRNALKYDEEKKYELINGLIKLFQDIDINGDKHMEWSEFTQYIIDAVNGEKEARFFDARFEKDRELTENEILDRAYSRKTKRYVQCQFMDNNTHSNIIKKLVFSPHTDYLYCLEQSDIQEPIIQNKKFSLQIPQEDNQRAFVIDFAIAEQLNQIAAVTSDRQIYFWENNLTHRVQKNFKMDVLLTGIWYLNVHKCWITAGGDYNIRTWNFAAGEDKKKIEPTLLLIAHMKQITDICELHTPLLVASCSLDGKIKLWDITDPQNPVNKTELRDQSTEQKRGILGMSYSSYYGSNLLTYGFDTHINVWCPQVSITRAFIGKLEGHSSLIVKCKFIPQSPNVISVDDKGNIRIWDIRTMGTIQVITSDSTYSLVTDISLITGKHDRFVMAGKRCIFYENAAATKSMKSINEDLSILQVEFNTYYNQFVLLTKIDIRCYDAMTGKLRKVFTEVHEDKFQVDLCCFCFGGGDRKFYLSDNAGLIRQYNMKNGEFLKNVNSINEIESSEFSKKQSHIKKRENNEISKIMYSHEEKLLIAAYSDSTIRIYDEADAEESVLIKVLSGAHKEADISSIAYSNKMNVLASGSCNGIIAIWNFETGKCDNLLLSDQSSLQSENISNGFEVTTLSFADPYPILVSGTLNGQIMVWGIGPKAQNYKYKCIMKIHNSFWQNGIRIVNPQITSLIVEAGEQSGVPHQKYMEDIFKPPTSFTNPIISQSHQQELRGGKKASQHQQQQQQQTSHTNLNILDSLKVGANKSSAQSKRSSFMKGEKEDYEALQEYWIGYEQNQGVKRRLYVYYTDIKGYMHCLHLTDILKNRDIHPIQSADKKKQSFQLRRKDLINASKIVENMLSAPDRFNEEHILEVHSVNSVLVKRWKAHKEKITNLTKLVEPVCYITCSTDKTVKIWSMLGKQYCQINLVKLNDTKENYWEFPFSWVQQKLKDIDHVFESLNIIENEVLTDEEKDNIKKKYLFNKYFNQMAYEEMIQQIHDKLYPKKQDSDDEADKAPIMKRLKRVDPKEQLVQKIQQLDEHLEGVETKKAQFNFTLDYRHYNTEITSLYTVKGMGYSTDSLKSAILVYSLDSSKRYNVSFRIRKQNGLLGVGICKRSVLEKQEYEMTNFSSGIGQGMYIITSNGKAYSDHNSDFDNVNTGFGIKYGDIVHCKLYPFSRELIFEIENTRSVFKHQVAYTEDPQEEPYSLVVLVATENDEVEYYGGEVIGRRYKANQIYKNMVDNSKQRLEIKQRVGLEFRPSQSFYGKLPRDIINKIDSNTRPTTEGLPPVEQDNFVTSYNSKKEQDKKKEGKKKGKVGGAKLQLISSSQKRLDKFNESMSKPMTSESKQSRMQSKHNKLFSMSQQTLVRNNNQIQNIIKEFDQRPSTKEKYKYQKDIKYKTGECFRQVRVTTNQYSYQIASQSPGVLFADNEVLTRKYKFYKDLASNQKGEKNLENEDFDDDDEDIEYKNQQEMGKKVPQIVATRNFWNNPLRNQHKIFKTGQKIYVIEQE